MMTGPVIGCGASTPRWISARGEQSVEAVENPVDVERLGEDGDGPTSETGGRLVEFEHRATTDDNGDAVGVRDDGEAVEQGEVRCSRQPQVTDEYIWSAAAQLRFPFLQA